MTKIVRKCIRMPSYEEIVDRVNRVIIRRMIHRRSNTSYKTECQIDDFDKICDADFSFSSVINENLARLNLRYDRS